MINRPPQIKRFALYLAVLVSGMTTLAVELSASRLLGALFGTSNIVWANIIGLILIYLALGYFLGGRWADRSPTATTLYQIVAWAAFLSGLVPTLAHLLLPVIARLGLSVGVATAAAMFALFAVPVTLLGVVPPFAIRLALATAGRAGAVAGKVYAISTLGSIIGALAPVLYLLPEAGTTATFHFFAAALLVIALAGLALHNRRLCLRLVWMFPVHVLLWALL